MSCRQVPCAALTLFKCGLQYTDLTSYLRLIFWLIAIVDGAVRYCGFIETSSYVEFFSSRIYEVGSNHTY